MLFTKVSILAVAGLVAANANINERYVPPLTPSSNHMLTRTPAMPASTSARPSP